MSSKSGKALSVSGMSAGAREPTAAESGIQRAILQSGLSREALSSAQLLDVDEEEEEAKPARRISRIGLVLSTVGALRTEVRAKASREDLRSTLTFLAEFFEYLLFLIVLIVVATNMNGLPDAFPLVDRMREALLADPPHMFDKHDRPSEVFYLNEGIADVNEMWEYLRDILSEELFSEDGTPKEDRPFIMDRAHRKIGAIRLVTARINSTWENCAELPVYRERGTQPTIKSCYPRPSADPESWSGEPFGVPRNYYRIDPALIDQSRVRRRPAMIGRRLFGEDARTDAGAIRVGGGEEGDAPDWRRQLRAGGGGGGGGRRDVSEGTGGETFTPEEKLHKMDIPSDLVLSQWQDFIDELQDHLYVDQQTRVLELLFTTYNAPSNLYCSVTIDMTMPFTGGVYGVATFYTVSPVRHLMFLTARADAFPPPNRLDILKLVAELLFLVLIVRTVAWETRKHWRTARRVLRDARKMDSDDTAAGKVYVLWLALEHGITHMDLFSVIQYASLGLHIVVTVRRMSALRTLTSLTLAPRANQFVDFHKVADSMYETQNILSINVLLSFISMFKFATVVPQLSMLNRTVSHAFADLVGFLVMFTIVFLGFMQAFQLSFGTDLLEFATGGESFYTLFAVLSGDVNLDELREANRLLGPVLFVMYAIFVMFVLLNMFVAIVTSSYAHAKKELKEDPQSRKLYNTIKYTVGIIVQLAQKQYKFLIIALRTRKTQREITQALSDGIVTESELREILRASGLAQPSDRFPTWRYWSNADLVLKRYDTGAKGWLTKEELTSLQADMEAEAEERKSVLERDFKDTDEQTRIENEMERRKRIYTNLSRKVDSLMQAHTELLTGLDQSRHTINSHIDTLTRRLWKIWESSGLI